MDFDNLMASTLHSEADDDAELLAELYALENDDQSSQRIGFHIYNFI